MSLAQISPLAAASLEKVNASYGAISGSMAQTCGSQRSPPLRKVRLGPKSRLHLRRAAQHHVPDRRQRAIRQSLRHARVGSLPAGADTALIASPMNQPSTRWSYKKYHERRAVARQSVGHEHSGLTDRHPATRRPAPEWHRRERRDHRPCRRSGARLSGLQTGRIHGAIIAGIQTLTANKLGFRTLIDYSKLPLEISGSGILARRSYVSKNPDITLKFLKAWIEGLYLFRTKPEFALATLKNMSRLKTLKF